MGTNYYIKNGKNCCECNGTGLADVHIGKSSYGWKFLFNPFKRSYEEWKAFLKGKRITDEYGRSIDESEFLDMVERKQKDLLIETSDTIDKDGYRISRHNNFS